MSSRHYLLAAGFVCSILACEAIIPDGRYVCDTTADCPPRFSCREQLCYRESPGDGDAGISEDGGRASTDAGPDASRDDMDGAVVADDSGLVDAFVPDAAEPDAGPLVCEGTDQGGVEFTRWVVPTDPTLGLPTAQSYTARGPIVVDNVSGLVWQRGFSPMQLSHADAIAYCRDLVLGECDDWRLPNVFELASIVDSSSSVPAIRQSAFPGTPGEPFWTTTPVIDFADQRRTVTFYDGQSSFSRVDADLYVRCVRDPVPRMTSRYVATADTVQDQLTRLVWQRSTTGAAMSHADALTYCANLSLSGMTDWRLPSLTELFSIVNASRRNPAIDLDDFGYPAGANFFWTSTINVTNSRPWFITFAEGGYPYADVAPDGAHVRCVR